MLEIINFPKIKSPFVRKEINGHYIVTPEIELGYEWVFEDEGVLASDKLHGTNTCIVIENGKLIAIDNRMNRIFTEEEGINDSLSKTQSKFLLGILNSKEKGWLKFDTSNRIYGELVGPSINGNIHLMETNFFIPFSYLKKFCRWNSWLANKYPKTFDSISEWFKELPSLFTKRITGKEELAEGIVFHHPDGRMAKLRRDMFDWYHHGI